MSNRFFIAATLTMLLCASTGCRFFQRRSALEPTPIVFHESPTLEQLCLAVNANTTRVITLQTRDARLQLRGLPNISVDLAYEQPRRLRFRAGTGFTGQELDLGSNDELFWFWAKQNQPQALMFARHADFARSPNRSMIPIEPTWIIDAMGLPQFDPNLRHEGPLPNGKNLEIRSHVPAADGEMTKVTVLHSQYAWVLSQQVIDSRGRLIASAQATDHEYYPSLQVALPRKVAISLPPVGLQFAIESSGYSINVPLADSAALFALPEGQLSGPLIDLADPRFALPAPTAQPVRYEVAPLEQATNRLRGMVQPGIPERPYSGD